MALPENSGALLKRRTVTGICRFVGCLFLSHAHVSGACARELDYCKPCNIRLPVSSQIPNLGTPVVPICPFCFGVSLLKLDIKNKGTLAINGAYYCKGHSSSAVGNCCYRLARNRTVTSLQ